MNKDDLIAIGEILEDQLEPIRAKLDKHDAKLDALAADVIDLQNKVKVLDDIHVVLSEAIAVSFVESVVG